MRLSIQLCLYLGLVALGTIAVCHKVKGGLAEPAVSINSINSIQRLMVERWEIPEPRLEFQRGESLVVLNYGTSLRNSEEHSAVSSSVTLWTKECRSGGGTELKPQDIDQSAVIVKENPNFSVSSVGIDLGQLWSDLGDQISDGTTSASTSISFCVRYALSAKTNTASGETEVNFVESVVTATTVIVVNEQQQVPRVITANTRHRKSIDDDYTIDAFVCNQNGGNNPAKTFTQGSVVHLCVQPSRIDGSIRIESIEEFTWKKLLSVDYDSVAVSQEAVKNGVPSDFFTIYKGCDSKETTYCSLKTLLLADFYTPQNGLIGGTGIVSLKFGKPRDNVPHKVQSVEIRSRNPQKTGRQSPIM